MMTEADTASTESIQPTRTDETTREQHLSRLEELQATLDAHVLNGEKLHTRLGQSLTSVAYAGESGHKANYAHSARLVERYRERAESLRWVIKRVRARS